MIAVAMSALALSAAQPAAEPAVENEIEVIAQKLRSIRLSPGVTIRKGVVTPGMCKIKRSSGDAEIDALACDAVSLCATRPQPNRKAFNACVDTEAQNAIYQFRDERIARNAALADAGGDAP